MELHDPVTRMKALDFGQCIADGLGNATNVQSLQAQRLSRIAIPRGAERRMNDAVNKLMMTISS